MCPQQLCCQDLKQFVWSLSVSSDTSFPLFQKAYSGNTSDVDTYVEQWQNLIDLLGQRDFLYVADSKIITKDNMAHIHDNEGFFIAPAPMYESYKTVFYDTLDQHDHEILIPYKNQIITNKPKEDLSIAAAMMAHKNQYKSEHTNRRAKSGYSLEPIYLQTPERIESLLLLFKIALQMIVLIERTARKNISKRDKGLNNFMPNKKDIRNPKTEYLLAEFQYVVRGEMVLPAGKTYAFVSDLNKLQKDILSILEVPTECFTYEYLFDTS